MISHCCQRFGSGTISTPEGGAVVNGALLEFGKAFNHENRINNILREFSSLTYTQGHKIARDLSK